MGKIVITTNMTLDGVVQDPDGREGFRLGGWFNEHGGADLAAWAALETEEARHAEALLLGRNSDEWFAARWTGRDGEWADALNAMPKYVVSCTLDEARWTNAAVLSGDVVEQVAKVRQDARGDVLIYASYRLARTLIDHDLVDELRLVVFPVVLGDGERLFGATTDQKPLRLLDAKPLGENLSFLTYEFIR
jgi:dihydrofolate reductase